MIRTVEMIFQKVAFYNIADLLKLDDRRSLKIN